MLIYIYICTQLHTLISTLNLAWTNTHLERRLFLALLEMLPLHIHTSSCLLEVWLMRTDTHVHTHTHAWLFAQTNIHFVVHSSFTLAGAFPLHKCSVACNLRTYFTSVGRVLLASSHLDVSLYCETSRRGAPVF